MGRVGPGGGVEVARRLAVPRVLDIGYHCQPLPPGVREPFEPGAAFDMTETARAFHASPAQVRVFLGGLNSTKTHTVARAALFAGFRNLGECGLVVEPTASLLRVVWYPAFSKALQESGLEEGRDWIYLETKGEFRVFGGGMEGVGRGFTVICRSGDAWSRIVGMNAAWCVIDEPAEMVAEAVRKAFERVRRGTEEKMVVGTPDPGSWVPDWRLQHADDPTFAWFQGSTMENPYVTQAYIDERVRTLSEEAARAYLYGECVEMSSGRAYRGFVAEPYPAGNLYPWKYDPSRPVILCCDNNRDPLCAVMVQRDGDRFHVFAEVFIRDGSFRELAEAVAVKLHREAPAGFILDGDSELRGRVSDEKSDWGDYYSIRQHLRRVFQGDYRVALKARKANPLVVDRLRAHNAALCDVAGTRRLLFDPSVERTIADHLRVQQDENGQIVKPKSGGRAKGVSKDLTHLSDALGYHVENVRPAGRPRRGPVAIGVVGPGG